VLIGIMDSGISDDAIDTSRPSSARLLDRSFTGSDPTLDLNGHWSAPILRTSGYDRVSGVMG
jgi:hypothetical protein